MKLSKVWIGNNVSVGAESVVLYDSILEDASEMGELSLAMKGEVLSGGMAWKGIPCSGMPCSDESYISPTAI